MSALACIVDHHLSHLVSDVGLCYSVATLSANEQTVEPVSRRCTNDCRTLRLVSPTLLYRLSPQLAERKHLPAPLPLHTCSLPLSPQPTLPVLRLLAIQLELMSEPLISLS